MKLKCDVYLATKGVVYVKFNAQIKSFSLALSYISKNFCKFAREYVLRFEKSKHAAINYSSKY